MESNPHTSPTHTPSAAAPFDRARTRRAFDTATNSIKAYGVLGAVALVAVVVVSSSGHQVNTFMWVRAILLPVVAGFLHRLTVSASRGSRRAFERVSALVVLLPIAIIGVDLIPGICPPWYVGTQVVCMLPVVRAAFVTRGSALRAAFPKSP
jgi:cytochrome bd-type quinol oxidase subunit 2